MRIAVLGCGSIGRRHLRNLQLLGNHELLSFDIAQEARKFVRDELGISAVSILQDVWDFSPEAVLICTPPDQHIEFALAAAKEGSHLFIEKPLSYHLGDIESLIAMTKRNQLISMVACNMRFHPGPMAVRRVIKSGHVGDILAARLQFGSYLPNWRPWQNYRNSYTTSSLWGGAILDCIHEIDLAFWYFGKGQVVAAAHLPATNLALENDGLAEIIIRHECGVLCNVHLNFIQRDYQRNCQIIGSEGSVYWDFGRNQVTVYDGRGRPENVLSVPDDWQLNQMYLDEMEHFIQSIETGKETDNTIAGGATALEAALDARRLCSLPSPTSE